MCYHAILSDIPPILDKITSPIINDIKISFRLDPEAIQLEEEGSWRTIPAILARPNFRTLRQLEFCVDRPTSCAKKLEAWVRGTLAELELRCAAVQVGAPPKVPGVYYSPSDNEIYSSIIYFFK
jgi:hypothetical protein